MIILSSLLLLIGIALLSLLIYIKLQGEAEFVFETEKQTEWLLEEKTENKLVFKSVIPFRNIGKQDGTLMDVFFRVQLPEEQYKEAEIFVKTYMQSLPRNDNYWEAIIIFGNTGDALVVKLTLESFNNDIEKALKVLPDFEMDIFYKMVSRSFAKVKVKPLLVRSSHLNSAWENGIKQDEPNLALLMNSPYAKDFVKEVDKRIDRLKKEEQIVENGKVSLKPVLTRILVKNDDLAEIIKNAKEEIGEHDVITVAESVVAILQGRFITQDELKVSLLARLLARFVPQKGSLSSIYGMQACMDMEGKWKITFGMVVGFLAKLVGKSGVFYRIAGEQPRLIDDVTGTIPPFDKKIVFGPLAPENFVKDLKKKFPKCFGVAIADVNDLKSSFILAATEGVSKEKLRKLLLDNPFGNAAQRTPIVIVKNFGKLEE